MLCDKVKCTGCFACYNICPSNAIEMIEDENGCIYPKINEDKCVKCGLCKRTCPSIVKVKGCNEQKCYAMYSRNKKIRENSTSGGIATTFSEHVIKNGGVVYGAGYTKDCNVQHIRVDNLNGLRNLQGSKYVHSYIRDIYKYVKKDLSDTDKCVLFIGTPCQIAGLKNFLGKEYDNLLVIDIICHGVPSQRYLKEEVKRINNGIIDVDRVNFRESNQYGFYIIKNNKIIYDKNMEQSPYCDAFMNALSLRENCYNCDYARPSRISDITIGDFWGLSEKSKFFSDRCKGVSTVIVSTKKGQEFIQRQKESFCIEDRPYEESVNGNSQLRNPTQENKNTKRFREEYPRYGFLKAYKRNTRLLRAKRNVKKIIKILIKK